MALGEVEKVFATFAGISAGDVEQASRYIDAEHFLQHNPYAEDGVAGLAKFIRGARREDLQIVPVRAIQDGPFVLTQAKGRRSDREVLFDVFRFESGLIVEHWAFSTKEAPPNLSGHTQFDGPTAATHLSDTEKNKAVVRTYYETFHIGGDHSDTARFFNDDVMVRHEPGVRDGVAAFLSDVEELMKHRTIDEIRLLIGQGDLVFIAATGTHEAEACVYVDLYRVQNDKIVEHWGFPERVPLAADCKNTNGML